jgi:3-hydroxybutyryl-CoA dehydratase
MNNYKFDEIFVGLEESFNVHISPEKMEQFFKITEDNNPLHINAEYAKSKGFSDRLVYGMLTASFFSSLVGVHLPGKNCILQGIDILFSNPIYINDKLIITGKVTYINQAFKQLEIKATIINQVNIKVSKANIKVGVLDE